MKNIKIIIFSLLIILFLIPINVLAKDFKLKIYYDTKLHLVGDDLTLFSNKAMVPGDTFEEKIVVDNKSNKEIAFLLSEIECLEGEKLLSAMEFIIEKDNKTIYQGNFEVLKNITLSNIKKNTTEEYKLIIHFNESAGNEYQGLSYKVKLIFEARDILEVETIAVSEVIDQVTDLTNLNIMNILKDKKTTTFSITFISGFILFKIFKKKGVIS